MNELAVSIGIILFPGIISTMVADKIIVHSKKWNSFKYFLYSFVLGVFCYLLLQVFGWGLDLIGSLFDCLAFLCATPISGKLNVWGIVSGSNDSIDLTEIFGAIVLSVPVAFIVSAVLYKKWLNKLADFFNVSSKYGDENLFSYFLNSKELNWIYVRDYERKLTYEGKIVSFSEDSKVQEIVLSDVKVYGYENSDEYYSVPFIYLCREQGSLIIEATPNDFLTENTNEEKTT